jgi:hypothetical protein
MTSLLPEWHNPCCFVMIFRNEKKGPVKSSTSSVADQAIPEPQEVQ